MQKKLFWGLMALAGVFAGCATAPSPVEPVKTAFDLPVMGSMIHVLADDVDGDGRPDLVFTAHGDNFSQVLLQKQPQVFTPGPKVTLVGFHPNDLVSLPGKLYLSNSEGEGRLKVLRPTPEGGFATVAETPLPQPRSTVVFEWPGWGMSLAVTPYAGRKVTLFKAYDSSTGKSAQQYDVVLPEGRYGVPMWMETVDLDGDGIVEILFTAYQDNKVWKIRHPGPEGVPRAELVWSYEHGAPHQALPVDLNGDGALDLLVPQQVGKEIVSLINDGKGNFQPGPALPFPVFGPYHAAIAVDRDGSRYLAGGGYHQFVLYRLGKAPGEAEQLSFPMWDWATFVVLKDVDGDGWLDLVMARKRKDKPSGTIIYGPLWEKMRDMETSGKKY